VPPEMSSSSVTPAYAPADALKVSVIRRWSDRWYQWRNRLLADPAFQRFARRNPFTRLIAQRRARGLFDLCAGFVYSQVLAACVEFRLFEFLRDGPQSRDAIAQHIGLDNDATDVLLRSATSLKLLQQRPNIDNVACYGLGIHGAALLANPGVCHMIEHHTFFYRDLTEPVELLKRARQQTMLSMFWDYAGAQQKQNRSDSNSVPNNDAIASQIQTSSDQPEPNRLPFGGMGGAPYTALMSASQAMIAEQIIDCYPLRDHQCLLDVGGGNGTFLRIAASAAPDLQLMLFDLPEVASLAQHAFLREPLVQGFSCHVGDVFNDALPTGADLVSLVRIIHDHNDAEALCILKRCRAALPPGGTLLIAEPMARARVGDPATDAYFGFYLHAMGRGKPRTAAELGLLLDKAGFVRHRQIATHMPMLVSLLAARVPMDDRDHQLDRNLL